MAGLDPNTGKKIYYPGENRSKRQAAWEGSPMHGGGLKSIIGPLLMFIGAIISLWALF